MEIFSRKQLPFYVLNIMRRECQSWIFPDEETCTMSFFPLIDLKLLFSPERKYIKNL